MYPLATRLKLRPLFISTLLVSIPFIIWDQIVTDVFWSFNPMYTLGPKLFKLPFEEVMFFLTVPASSLFLWKNFESKFKSSQISQKYFLIPSIILFCIGLLNYPSREWYTNIMCYLPLLTIIIDKYFSISLLKEKTYLLFQPVIFVLTLIFNTYLTARPVVTYNPQMFAGFRLGTVPVEDFVYGWILITLFISIYKKASRS